MKCFSLIAALALAAAFSTSALAGFVGQTVLGPLELGSVVSGDTTPANDNNDGSVSGRHSSHIWTGPDDVWKINWPGGDLALHMFYNSPTDDLDLFLYTPADLNSSGNYSTLHTGAEDVFEPGAVAGTYYVVIDSPGRCMGGPYTLSVTPEPGTLAMLAVAVALLARRRG